MFEFLANNPFCLLGICFMFTPGVIPMGLAYWLGRNGSPIRISWRGHNGNEV